MVMYLFMGLCKGAVMGLDQRCLTFFLHIPQV
jgi:hypothetical protein